MTEQRLGAGGDIDREAASAGKTSEALAGFELDQAEVCVTGHSHGPEADDLPMAMVVARHPGPTMQGV